MCFSLTTTCAMFAGHEETSTLERRNEKISRTPPRAASIKFFSVTTTFPCSTRHFTTSKFFFDPSAMTTSKGVSPSLFLTSGFAPNNKRDLQIVLQRATCKGVSPNFSSGMSGSASFSRSRSTMFEDPFSTAIHSGVFL